MLNDTQQYEIRGKQTNHYEPEDPEQYYSNFRLAVYYIPLLYTSLLLLFVIFKASDSARSRRRGHIMEARKHFEGCKKRVVQQRAKKEEQQQRRLRDSRTARQITFNGNALRCCCSLMEAAANWARLRKGQRQRERERARESEREREKGMWGRRG